MTRGARKPILTILGVLWAAPLLWGQAQLEYQVKAAYLYNFAKFVTWPAGADGEEKGMLTICVIGKDPFGKILENTVQAKTVRGLTMAIRRLPPSARAQGCQIAFSDCNDAACRSRLLQTDWEGVLLVGEGDEFVQCGGMIALTVRDGRVQFEINLEAVNRAHLEVSSKLLQVARVVSTTKGKP